MPSWVDSASSQFRFQMHPRRRCKNFKLIHRYRGRWRLRPGHREWHTKCGVVFEAHLVQRIYGWSRTCAPASSHTNLYSRTLASRRTSRHSISRYVNRLVNEHWFRYGPNYSPSTARGTFGEEQCSIISAWFWNCSITGIYSWFVVQILHLFSI